MLREGQTKGKSGKGNWIFSMSEDGRRRKPEGKGRERAHQHFVFSLLPLTVDSQTSF
jgi:hypothetical protein